MTEPLVEHTCSSTRAATPARSGPVIGRFLTGLRDGRIVGGAARRRPGARAADRVRPVDERGGRARRRHWIEVGPRGTVQTFTWVARAARRASTASTKPFAFALIRPDGADTAMLHVVDCGSADAIRVGIARRAALAGRAHRLRSPTSRRGSRSATARSPSRRRCTCPAEDEQPVTGITVPIRLEYELTAGVATGRYLEGPRPRARSSAPARRRADDVYAASRGTDPIDGRADVDRGRGRSDTGVITTFCVVNIPGLSELAPEIPYVSRADPARRREQHVLRADPRHPRSTRCTWACA